MKSPERFSAVFEIAEEKAIPRKRSKNPGHFESFVKYNKKTGAIHAAIPIFQFNPENVYPSSPMIKLTYFIVCFLDFNS